MSPYDSGRRPPSKRLIASYLLDWVLIIAVAAGGGVLYKIKGAEHLFRLDDPAIGYPLLPDTVTVGVAAAVAVALPAAVIALLSLAPSSPLPSSLGDRIGLGGGSGSGSGHYDWRSRLWRWNAGWLGLGMSLAGAFFVTSGLKDVVGKPRPDLLARCDPDLSRLDLSPSWSSSGYVYAPSALVDTSICRQPDASVLDDGFASWPSGHSSIAWAGLLYLSLWLAHRFALTFPQQRQQQQQQQQQQASAGGHWRAPVVTSSSGSNGVAASSRPGRGRGQGKHAAPPVSLLVLAFAPVGGALYIAASRWADYHHAGFDVISGSAVGAAFAVLGFRWYHPSLLLVAASDGGDDGDGPSRGAAWGPREAERAFLGGGGGGGGGDGEANRGRYAAGDHHIPLRDLEDQR